MEPNRRPLSECVLMAVFRPADFGEVPTTKFRELWPEMELEPVAGHESAMDRSFSLDRPVPLYRLTSKKEKDSSPIINFGVNSISYNASGDAYRRWEDFRDEAVDVLEKTNAVFDKRARLEPLNFQYVDILEGDSFDELAQAFEPIQEDPDYRAGFEHSSKQVVTEKSIAGKPSFIARTYEVFYVEDEEGEVSLKLLVYFNVQTGLARPTSNERVDELRQWLEAAHDVHKKLLWDALCDDYREGIEPALFDAAEERRFSGMSNGLAELHEQES